MLQPIAKPDFCADDPSVSLIITACQKVHIPPKTFSGFAVMALYAAVDNGLLKKEQVIRTLDLAEYTLADANKTSYTDVIIYVQNQFGSLQGSKAWDYISFLPVLLPTLKVDVLLSPCDRKMLLFHIAEQRLMLKRYFPDGAVKGGGV